MSAINPSPNGLSLLALKCAANTFDLSTGVTNVSLRDQIVRGQLLIRDLKAKDPDCKKILVVGAGLGGVSAALMATHLGIQVVLVDTQAQPFSLQSKVISRYVGPFMYEWPAYGHDSQDYPASWLGSAASCTPNWSSDSPLPAAEIANQIKVWLGKLDPKELPDSFMGVGAAGVISYVQRFVGYHRLIHKTKKKRPFPAYTLPSSSLDLNGKKPTLKGDFMPNYVILAAGMGQEKVTVVGHPSITGLPFWANDGFRRRRSFHGVAGIFGGGDGAIQDALRLLTQYDHPLTFIRALESDTFAGPMLKKYHLPLLALEQQCRLLAMWMPNNAFDAIDNECRKIAHTLAKSHALRAAVFRRLRPGSGQVHHIWRETAFGKAYLLNRFSLHLIEQCLQRRTAKNRVTYHAHRKTEIKSSRQIYRAGYHVAKIGLSDGTRSLELTHIAVRHGVEPITPGGQMVTLNKAKTADRVSMAGILQPVQLNFRNR